MMLSTYHAELEKSPAIDLISENNEINLDDYRHPYRIHFILSSLNLARNNDVPRPKQQLRSGNTSNDVESKEISTMGL